MARPDHDTRDDIRPRRPTGDFLVTIEPEPREVPYVRHALRRRLVAWNLMRHRKVVELLASELLAQVITTATSKVDVHAHYEADRVRVEIEADVAPEPLRLRSVADMARRRSEAILAALSLDHGADMDAGHERAWFEVDTRRPPWEGH
ncbi:MAG TPA: hypothetical protein VM618_11075 [Acidimicrobiia bacterium]|nr:hypothetical protein [Acidimicrobiia bacterium]